MLMSGGAVDLYWNRAVGDQGVVGVLRCTCVADLYAYHRL
jgi:hypothetical protein